MGYRELSLSCPYQNEMLGLADHRTDLDVQLLVSQCRPMSEVIDLLNPFCENTPGLCSNTLFSNERFPIQNDVLSASYENHCKENSLHLQSIFVKQCTLNTLAMSTGACRMCRKCNTCTSTL